MKSVTQLSKDILCGVLIDFGVNTLFPTNTPPPQNTAYSRANKKIVLNQSFINFGVCIKVKFVYRS